MKRYLTYCLLVALMVLAGTVGGAHAKRAIAPNMYMFGFAASFGDTIVYFTDIQHIDSAWVDKKSDFLQSRDIYSAQLRDYLAKTYKLDNRTCVVFYSKNRNKLEKKYVKLRRLYAKGKDGREHFDLRMLEPGEFSFTSIDLTEDELMEQEQKGKKRKAPRWNSGRKERGNTILPNIDKFIEEKISEGVRDIDRNIRKKQRNEVDQRLKEREEYEKNRNNGK